MTSDTIASLGFAAAAVLVAAMFCAAGLTAWRGWLAYKKLQLAAEAKPDQIFEDPEQPDDAETGVRIELAAVKERLRRLEAIASGVEL